MTPAFACSGGDVIWNGDPRTPLTKADTDYLRGMYRDEAEAAFRAGDDPAFDAAVSLLAELLKALKGQKEWMSCALVSPPLPTQGQET
jgi:hypothetical protein